MAFKIEATPSRSRSGREGGLAPALVNRSTVAGLRRVDCGVAVGR